MVRKIVISLVSVLLVGVAISASAQGYDEEKTALTNYITRMYKSAPFEGVKVFMDYDNSYLLSILTLDKNTYPNTSAMNRVAGVKAMSQASRYFNGADISSDLIIRSVERSDGIADSEIIENIRERSAGYVKALELLTTFEGEGGRQVFIFYKQLED